jgi:dGTPase
MIYTREMIEDVELKTLAPYASHSRHSRGREHPESESAHRSAFQRDRDRVLHTTAFRRLEYKTQVFVNHEGDYYRTRLTHTLEVTQIGRSIARALGANEDLIEAICLVHDIGHPPFGHSGEKTLATLMEAHGGFDHNQQALRIVTHLERRYPDFSGLNLTYEVREGIVKHETEYDVSHAEGYEPDKRGGIEAQIANIADELTYCTHDLDDGLYAELLRPAQLDGLALWEWGKGHLQWNKGDFDEVKRHSLHRELIGFLVEDTIAATQARIAAADPQSPEDLQTLPHNVVTHSEEVVAMMGELRDFLYQNMYQHYRVVRMAGKAERFINELFRAYVAVPDQLPTSTKQRLAEGLDPLERIICDYIAGMTDRYALQEYCKFFDPHTRP